LAGLYHGAVGARNVSRPVPLLRKSKTSVDARDFQLRKRHRSSCDGKLPVNNEQKRLHSLIKMLNEDSIDKNNTCGMRLFRFADENTLQESDALPTKGSERNNTFPRFLPAQTFDEKSEWNDIIHIFDSFEQKLYDGIVTGSKEEAKEQEKEQEEHHLSDQMLDDSVVIRSPQKRKLGKKYSRRSCERISVEFWLASLQLIQYCDVLNNNGFDNLKFMVRTKRLSNRKSISDCFFEFLLR
jgi:hypothetical protein